MRKIEFKRCSDYALSPTSVSHQLAEMVELSVEWF
ncbi:MAG: hypothetical protein PWQ72_2041, partial [Pseudothermotoga sp.]|nr:hypothetical protein [Pseudothermotoga sp.]